MSNEFQVNIGLRQGSALSQLLFILVMELISRKKSTTYALWKIMYADDLVIVAEHRKELQLKGHCIEFKYYADGIHSGLTPPG